MLYRKENIGEVLYLLSFTSVFIYLQQTLLGIMNGLGKQGICLRNSMVGYVIRIAFVIYLIPVYGIKGYIVGMVVSSAVVCALNLGTVVKTTGMILDIRNWLIKPGIIGVIMFVIGRYVFYFFTIFKLSGILTILMAIFGNVLIAFILLFLFGVLDKKEMMKLIGISSRT
jgi:stage V sporulation protein B